MAASHLLRYCFNFRLIVQALCAFSIKYWKHSDKKVSMIARLYVCRSASIASKASHVEYTNLPS